LCNPKRADSEPRGRFKRVIGDALRSHTELRRVTEVVTAVRVLNRMLELGQPEYVRLS